MEDPVLPAPEDSSLAHTVTFNRLAYYAAGGGDEEEGPNEGEEKAGEDSEPQHRHNHIYNTTAQDQSPHQARGRNQHQHQQQHQHHCDKDAVLPLTLIVSDPSLQLEYDTEPCPHFETQGSEGTTQESQEHRGGFDVTADVNTVVHNPLLYSDEQST